MVPGTKMFDKMKVKPLQTTPFMAYYTNNIIFDFSLFVSLHRCALKKKNTHLKNDFRFKL